MDAHDLENRFTYHPPDTPKAQRHQLIRGKCHDLALLLDDEIPDGREKSLAITKLEEVMFWANAAIARH